MTSYVYCGYAGAVWEQNSHGQDACEVYAELQGVCNSGFTISSVTPTSTPYQPQNNACGCNVVAYNLQAACGWCQQNILSNWWLTENQWEGNCTVGYNSNGISSTVDYHNVDIPPWAFATPTGTSWSPSQASVYALNHPYDTHHRNPGRAAGIIVGIILGFYVLLAIVIGVVYYMRQKKRKAWYVPMGQYYAGLKNGGGGGIPPPVYHTNPTSPYDPPKTLSSAPLNGGGYTYQPPPPEQPQPANSPGYNPGYGPNTNSMYGGSPPPPPGAAAPAPGGYKGLAEVH